MSERHVRQERLAPIGTAGQRRLARARVAIVGVGATGSHLAAVLGRAGVGRRVDGEPKTFERMFFQSVLRMKFECN